MEQIVSTKQTSQNDRNCLYGCRSLLKLLLQLLCQFHSLAAPPFSFFLRGHMAGGGEVCGPNAPERVSPTQFWVWQVLDVWPSDPGWAEFYLLLYLLLLLQLLMYQDAEQISQWIYCSHRKSFLKSHGQLGKILKDWRKADVVMMF